MIPIEKFEAQSMNGNFVPIVPGGGNIHLTYHNRKEYVEKALQFRLHELDQQVRFIDVGHLPFTVVTSLRVYIHAGIYIYHSSLSILICLQVAMIRDGMAIIVPVPLLSLYTAKMLESAVCGNEDVDLQMLKKVVRYVIHWCLKFVIGWWKCLIC